MCFFKEHILKQLYKKESIFTAALFYNFDIHCSLIWLNNTEVNNVKAIISPISHLISRENRVKFSNTIFNSLTVRISRIELRYRYRALERKMMST